MLRQMHLHLGKLIHAYPPVTETTRQNHLHYIPFLSCRCHSMSLDKSDTIIPQMPPSQVFLNSVVILILEQGGGGENASVSFIENLEIHFLFLALKESKMPILLSQNYLKRGAYCMRVSSLALNAL